MTKAKIKRDLDQLALRDTEVLQAVAEFGYPPSRKRSAGFEAFLRIIVSQQISTQAASAVYERVESVLGGPHEINVQRLHKCKADLLRKAGMSARKVEYAKGLAQAILGGDFDPENLPALEDAAAIDSITALRGFGVWSAEIYLMFSLGRCDIFAADDLALRVALGKLKQLKQTPTARQARDLVAHWSPYRSAASLFLWHYYRGAPQ